MPPSCLETGLSSSRKVRESSLWRWLSQSKLELGGDLHLTRVENLTHMGVPDVEGCYKGAVFQIELKTAFRPSFDTTPIRAVVQPSQVLWAKARLRAGGVFHVLLQAGANDRFLLPGSAELMEELGDVGLCFKDLLTYRTTSPAETILRVVS